MFMTRRFASKTQLGGHEIEETAIDFRAGDAEPARIFLTERVGVLLKAHQQALRRPNAPDGWAELIGQPKDVCDVVIEHEGAGPLQRQSRALCGDKGVAVAVTAYPRSEPQQIREILRALRIDHADRVFEFDVEPWNGVEQDHGKEIEAHVDFVVDGGPLQADFVSLPEGSDFGEDLLFVVVGVGGGEGEVVESFEATSDTAPL